MTKKIVTIIMIISLFSTFTSLSVFAEKNSYVNLTEGKLLKQELYEKSDTENAIETIEEEASINATYLQNYIDCNNIAKKAYGGCYIDDEGNLNVLFLENVQNYIIDDVNVMTENKVILKNCKYTLDELMVLKDYISQFINYESTDNVLSNLYENIVAVGIYQKENKVFVRLKDCSNEQIETFKKNISDSSAIIFEQSDGYVTCSSEIKCGSKILITSGSVGGEYSVAFRCKRLKSNGEYAQGFMTAAHGNSAGDSVYVYTSGSTVVKIGYIMAWCYTNNGKVDSAFVYISNSNYIMSNTIHSGAGTLVSGAYASSYPEGKTVYMAGATSTLKSGKIVSSSMIADGSDDDGVTIKDCVEASYLSDPGDSGGLVYLKQNNQQYIAGINVAECYENKKEVGSIFVKAKNVVDVLNIIPY